MQKGARALKERQKYVVSHFQCSMTDCRNPRGIMLASLALAPGYLIPRLQRSKPELFEQAKRIRISVE